MKNFANFKFYEILSNYYSISKKKIIQLILDELRILMRLFKKIF